MDGSNNRGSRTKRFEKNDRRSKEAQENKKKNEKGKKDSLEVKYFRCTISRNGNGQRELFSAFLMLQYISKNSLT